MNFQVLSRALQMIPFSARNKIKNIPGIAYVQRMILARTLDGREFEHRVDAGPAKGISFLIKMPDDKGIWTGAYEFDFATLLATKVKPGSVAYDIGSWHGFFTGVMAAQDAAHVHVFEPLPVNAALIRRLIELNPAKAITLHACALGEQESEMDLIIMPESSMAKLEISAFQAGETSAARVRVKVRSIDTMVGSGEIAPPALMKIDVEGAEVMVLKGGLTTIRQHKPVIFAEVHSSALLVQCQSFLEAENYSVELVDGDPAAARARDVFLILATPLPTA